MTILRNGNVGIGTTSPQNLLHLGDNANSKAGTIRIDSFVANQFWKIEPGTNTLNIKDYDGTSLVSFDGASNYALFNGGNVGIGTTSPASKLNVASTGANAYSATLDSASNMKGIRNVLTSNADDMVGIYFATGSSTTGTHWSGITGSRSDNASHWGTQLNFYTHNNDVANLNHATQKMVIKGDGNVGIGTTSPGHKLSVNSGTTPLHLNRTGGATALIGLDIAGVNRGLIGATTTAAFVSYSSAAASLMTVLNTGNVGIGTTSPSYKLDVNGIIRSENSSEVGTLYLGNTAQSEIPGGAIIGQRSPNYSSTGNLLFQVPTWGANTDYGLTTQMSIEVTGADTKKATISMIPFGGNVEITDALLSNQENTDIDTGAEVVAQVAHATYTAAFFDFVVKKGTNVRSGTVYACHDGDTTPLVEFTETSTNDLGDTSDVTLSVDISGANMRLLATVTSDDWSVKSLIRAI
jgi:hypothetical protein